MTNSVIIPAFKAPVLAKRLEKLAKKAAKYGNDDIGYVISQPFVETFKDPATGEKRKFEMVEVSVWGDAPVYENGWRMIARIELGQGVENLVHEVPAASVEVDASKYRKCDNKCDHCGFNRSRKDVYVFEKDGQEMIVGRTCLRDFIGCDDPKMITERAAFFEAFRDIDESEERDIFGQANYYLLEVLRQTAAHIRKDGFVSRANANIQGIQSTGDCVGSALNGVPGYVIEEIEEDTAWAEKTIEMFRVDADFGDTYLDNIRVLFQTDFVNPKHMGLVCSAVQACQRSLAKKATMATAAAQSTFVGAVGSRIKGVAVTLEKEIYLGETMYGTAFLYSFKDESGNVIVWKTGPRELTEGQAYTLDGSVKEHKDYKGIAQTIVTRAKLY